jgi:1,4-alpha-glucan branching enzyme
MGGNHFTWNNIETEWMWPPLYDAEARLKALANKYSSDSVDDGLRGVLNQAARELLLAESSDWPFLVTTGQARDYAVQRFSEHLERFIALIESAEAGKPDGALAASLWEKDRLFENIDYRWWGGE